MRQSTLDALSQTAAEVAALAASVLGSGLLTVLGLLAENAAVRTVATGELVLGLWLLFAGGLALAAGLLVGSREAYPRATLVAARVRRALG